MSDERDVKQEGEMKRLSGNRHDRVRGVDPFRDYQGVPQDDGLGILALATYESMSGNPNAGSTAIEWSEKEGQRRLTQSEKLPVAGTKGHEDQFRAMGIDLGPISDDRQELFRDADLPSGWKIQPTDHSMWSNLVDDKGSVRAMVFYKAAFYDRSAHIGLRTRFIVEGRYNPETHDKTCFEVKDRRGPKTLFSSPQMPPHPGLNASREEIAAYYEMEEESRSVCLAWLTERYPDFNNPLAYWDVE